MGHVFDLANDELVSCIRALPDYLVHDAGKFPKNRHRFICVDCAGKKKLFQLHSGRRCDVLMFNDLNHSLDYCLFIEDKDGRNLNFERAKEQLAATVRKVIAHIEKSLSSQLHCSVVLVSRASPRLNREMLTSEASW